MPILIGAGVGLLGRGGNEKPRAQSIREQSIEAMARAGQCLGCAATFLRGTLHILSTLLLQAEAPGFKPVHSI
jgi:hypothetical protein